MCTNKKKYCLHHLPRSCFFLVNAYANVIKYLPQMEGRDTFLETQPNFPNDTYKSVGIILIILIEAYQKY